MLAPSGFVATIDAEACSDCDACAPPRCPMDAITNGSGSYAVAADRCIGCGVCAPVCPTEAIRLVRRQENGRPVPPKDIVHWSVERMSSRSGPLTRIALKMWLSRQAAKAARDTPGLA